MSGFRIATVFALIFYISFSLELLPFLQTSLSSAQDFSSQYSGSCQIFGQHEIQQDNILQT